MKYTPAERHYFAARSSVVELGPMSASWFDTRRRSHRPDTLQASGAVPGLTREAIYNFRARGSLLRWLPLACLGYEHLCCAAVPAADLRFTA